MSGSAVLGSSLFDSLVPVVDELRRSLHPAFGTRRFTVTLVTRTYRGDFGGEQFTDTEHVLDPPVKVESYVEQIGESITARLQPCGLDEAGVVVLKEISPTYTERELYGPPADQMKQTMLIKIGDAHGQQIRNRYFVPAGPPYPDVDTGLGWRMRLNLVSEPETP